MSRPQPRFSDAQKRDIVKKLLRLGGGTKPSGQRVVLFAEQLGVRRETLYRWLRNPNLRADETVADETDPCPPSSKNARFEVDTNMLTVVAQEQTRLHAYEKLTGADLITVSYATFCRALDRMPPDVVAGAMSGRKAMASSRVYLKKYVPHRCHTYFMDHTKLDLWVMPDHRSTNPVRPHLTVVGDAYSGYLWAFVWYRNPRSEDLAAALASTGIDRIVNGVPVGGVPLQLTVDNAAEHFADPMRETCSLLGIIVAASSAYSSWQNGKAERAIQVVNRLVCDTAPGAIRTGSDTSSLRFLETVRAKTDPASLWSAAALEARVRDVVSDVNTRLRRQDRSGLTRLELFGNDPTDRTFLSAETSLLLALSTSKSTYRASKSGIQYKNRHFVSAEISPGREYQVKYLPGTDEFIELFDVNGRHLTRAYNQDALPDEERRRILSVRAQREREVRAVEEGVKAHRRHAAALDNESALVDAPVDELDDLPARDPNVTQAPKRKKLRRVSPTKPDAKAIAAADQEYRKQLESPAGQDVLALVASINSARKKSSDND